MIDIKIITYKFIYLFKILLIGLLFITKFLDFSILNYDNVYMLNDELNDSKNKIEELFCEKCKKTRYPIVDYVEFGIDVNDVNF